MPGAEAGWGGFVSLQESFAPQWMMVQIGPCVDGPDRALCFVVEVLLSSGPVPTGELFF